MYARRDMARELRREGLSYSEIHDRLGVSKGTLSLWCRDTELTQTQLLRLRDRGWGPEVAAARAESKRRTHEQRREAIRTSAIAEVAALEQDPFWVAGLVAYWAEGSKSGTRLVFANSDAALVRLFMRWSSTFLGIDGYSVHLDVHDGQDVRAVQAYWIDQCSLSPTAFTKPYVKPHSTGHRTNLLYWGTASIRARRSAAALVRTLAWIDEYARRRCSDRAVHCHVSLGR